MTKKRAPYKTFLIVILVFIGFLAFGTYSGFFGVGSYPYSEDYEFRIRRDNLIKVLESFKKNHPAYEIPKQVGIEDGFDSDSNKIFYNAYIYLRNKNQIAHFVLIQDIDDRSKSAIWLHAVNDGLQLGHWRIINNDIGRTENLEIKKQFTTEVLDKLGLAYKDAGNSMLVFWK
jgi:hypothetical protein